MTENHLKVVKIGDVHTTPTGQATKIDWHRWPDDPWRGYLLRLISQVVWVLAEWAGTAGLALHVWLCRLSDWILDRAYPYIPPVEIELDIGQDLTTQ